MLDSILEEKFDFHPLDKIEFSGVKVVCFDLYFPQIGNKYTYQKDNYETFTEVKRDIQRTENPNALKGLFLYSKNPNHIELSKTRYTQHPWNSRQIGYIYVSDNQYSQSEAKELIDKAIVEMNHFFGDQE